MKARHRRFAWIAAGVATLGVAVALVLNAFQSNLVFFFTPTQVAAKEAPQGRPFRIGGLVETGSFARVPNTLEVRFVVTDTAQRVPVSYSGLLPDLFKEGKGVVAQGSIGPDGLFRATEVLAKHDENYMPPEAAAALEAAQKDRARAPVGGDAAKQGTGAYQGQESTYQRQEANSQREEANSQRERGSSQREEANSQRERGSSQREGGMSMSTLKGGS